MEDLDDISRENQKLKQYDSEQDIADIVLAIGKMQFSQAIGLIDDFIKKYHSVAVYQDADILALKLEIRLLEHEITLYDDERTELEKLMNEFNHRHSVELGDIIGEILTLKKQLAEQSGDTASYQEAEQDEQNFHEQLTQEKQKVRHELTPERQKELKQLYRKASQLCHPDRVNDEQKQLTEQIFSELRQAYEENNLREVKAILANLQKGIFKSRSQIVNQLDKLKSIKEQLSSKLSVLIQTVADIKASESYQEIIAIDDWDGYFSNQYGLLIIQRDLLKAKLEKIQDIDTQDI